MTFVPRVHGNATDVIGNISVTRWDEFLSTWGGFSNQTTQPPDAGRVIYALAMQYQDIVGPIFFVILFAGLYILLWISHSDLTPASIVGVFFGIYMSLFVGGTYFYAGLLMIALGITTTVWSLSQKRG